jgi:hypothetical protein
MAKCEHPIISGQEEQSHHVHSRSVLPYSDDSSDYGSHDESIEDEAAEDSNGTVPSTQPYFIPLSPYLAEDWYANDYPDEESDPSGLSDGPEDSDEDAFYDGKDDEIADEINYDGPEWEDD